LLGRKYIDAPTFDADAIRQKLFNWIAKWENEEHEDKGKFFTTRTSE
jgi:hypothetical protein